MPHKEKPDKVIETPKPRRTPEIKPLKDPNEVVIPDENPRINPDESPDKSSPPEMPEPDQKQFSKCIVE